MVGWIERNVSAPSDTAFYRIGSGQDRAATHAWAVAARFNSCGPLPMTGAMGTIEP